MSERYAVMDVDRRTILTADETVTTKYDGQTLIVAEEGQNVFFFRSYAQRFLEAHQDDDGFGPELAVVSIEVDA